MSESTRCLLRFLQLFSGKCGEPTCIWDAEPEEIVGDRRFKSSPDNFNGELTVGSSHHFLII